MTDGWWRCSLFSVRTRNASRELPRISAIEWICQKGYRSMGTQLKMRARPLARRQIVAPLLAAIAMHGSVALTAPPNGMPQNPECGAVPGGKSICNVLRPEDIAQLPGTKWVLASGYAKDALYRIDKHTHQPTNLVPEVRVLWNRKTYPECPGPLARDGLTAHGIAVGAGNRSLLVINHGSREAIEFYRINRRNAGLTWVGCLPLPADMMANSLVQLRTGALIVTSLGKPHTNFLPDIVAGRPTGGDVRRWTRTHGWSILPNSQGSGPNGLALAPDEQSVFVAMSGTRDIVRMALDGQTMPVRSAQMNILPDNLRWTAQGTLTTTGMLYNPETNIRCFQGGSCMPPFDVYEISPETLTVKSWSGRFETRTMPLTTTALRVGNELWVSSIGGESIAVFPLKLQ